MVDGASHMFRKETAGRAQSLTHMEMFRTQYLVFPNEPKGSCIIAAIFLTARQRPLFLHPGLYF